jgi:ankyrin repeat protein
MDNPLNDACYKNNLGLVQELLDRGADPNLQDVCGQTALTMASRRGHIDIVRLLLLNHGADPNLQDKWGWTALIRAAYRGCTDIVRLLLLDRRADPNLRDFRGWTASMMASMQGNIDVVELLEAACWNRKIVQPLTDLGIFPEGLIREHLTI